MKKGKFMVIDGSDGSGKETQTKLLIKRLKKENIPVETIDFPQHNKPSGFFVDQYLNGIYGDLHEVDPKKAVIFYAIDRFHNGFLINKWLTEGKHVVVDRYVSANMGHQAGRYSNSIERDEIIDFIEDIEFKVFEIPKPDKNIILYMPPEIGQKLSQKSGKKDYVTKKDGIDIHEQDSNHLKEAANSYLYLAEKYNWPVVHCYKGDELLSREVIHDEVYKHFMDMIS